MKYYVPKIQEFYVGFDFESFDPGGLKEYKETQYSLNNAIFIENLYEKGYQSAYVRVKCLDREDIESLGFDHDQTTKDGAVFYKGNLVDKNQWCLTADKMNYREISIYDANGNSYSVFHGVIKNKSELKKLMLQLGIK